MNIAVILAGGSGSRLGGELPKQFYKIAGKMVIEHTIDVFQNHKDIHEIAIVANPDYVFEIENIVIRNRYTKLKKILKGGDERYKSSLCSIKAYEINEGVNLIFHDAVRPLVNERIISDVINALSLYNAVDVAIKTTDTIIQVSEENVIDGIPMREKLRSGQTPQGFKIETIKEAYNLALKDPNFRTTDDCGVVYKYLPNEPVYIVDGEVFNIKLTYKEDIFLIDKLFQLKSLSIQQKYLSTKTDEIQSKLNEKVVVVFGGSYGIGKDIVNLCVEYGAKVYSFSRTTTNTDISNESSVRKALAEVNSIEGNIDFVVNTAGVLNKEPLVHMNYKDIFSSINVNYIGSIIVSKESFLYLKESKGAILLFTSSSYTKGRSMYSIYSSSKAAIVNLTQALSEEWYHFGVKINCVNPERTKTPMRIKNFGIEEEDTLLSSKYVAMASIYALISNQTGEVVDIKIINS